MIDSTTLSEYNLFHPMQTGQLIHCWIASRKCNKICKNEPFLPGSFTLWMLLFVGNCHLFYSQVAAQINGNFEANRDRAVRVATCELANFCLSMCKLLDGSVQTGVRWVYSMFCIIGNLACSTVILRGIYHLLMENSLCSYKPYKFLQFGLLHSSLHRFFCFLFFVFCLFVCLFVCLFFKHNHIPSGKKTMIGVLVVTAF